MDIGRLVSIPSPTKRWRGAGVEEDRGEREAKELDAGRVRRRFDGGGVMLRL